MKNKNYRSQICSKTKFIENKTNIFGQDEISSKGIPYDIKCYDFDRLILTKLLICSLLVWKKEWMKGQRATVPPIEKVYFYCAQEEHCFWNYIAVYFNRLHVLAVCFKHILLQNFPPSQCTCIDGKFSSNMDTLFCVIWTRTWIYRGYIHVFKNIIISQLKKNDIRKIELWSFSLLLYTFTYLTCSLWKWNNNGWK